MGIEISLPLFPANAEIQEGLALANSLQVAGVLVAKPLVRARFIDVRLLHVADLIDAQSLGAKLLGEVEPDYPVLIHNWPLGISEPEREELLSSAGRLFATSYKSLHLPVAALVPVQTFSETLGQLFSSMAKPRRCGNGHPKPPGPVKKGDPTRCYCDALYV